MAYRDNIDRLARRITDRIPVKFKKLKEDDPEYKCLSEILNDEQCNLCLFFEVRKPMSFEEILKNAKENKMISLCFTEGLSSKIKKTDSLKGKTDDICTFCDFICTSCKK